MAAQGDQVVDFGTRASMTAAAGSSGTASVGACGLYCPACAVFIGSKEEPRRLELLAGRMEQTPEELHCEGCRSKKVAKYCQSCELIACATEKGHEFCGECADFPCSKLEEFGRQAPHRAEIMQDLRRIAEVGRDTWVKEVQLRYACLDCGTTNSAYDLNCRRCGCQPGSSYAADHFEAIRDRLLQARVGG